MGDVERVGYGFGCIEYLGFGGIDGYLGYFFSGMTNIMMRGEW